MNVIKLKRRPARLECSSCGAEGSGTCDCGVPYVAAGTKAAQMAAENPGITDRALAALAGVSKTTANRALKAVGPRGPTVGPDGKT
jgi:hypothetical protein